MNNIQPILNVLNQRNFELLEGQDITPLFEHLTTSKNHILFVVSVEFFFCFFFQEIILRGVYIQKNLKETRDFTIMDQ